jgi:adenosine deaminase
VSRSEAQANGDLAARMPKAELHLHLDGSLRPATALELARRRGLAGGRASVASMRRRLVAPRRCADQAELLQAFDLPIALLQDEEALERCARELIADVAADGTRYVEVRWAPALHTAGGLSLDQVIAAVATGTTAGATAAGITARLIVTAMRSHAPAGNVAVAEAAARARPSGVVGFDLAGLEAAFPDALAHRRAFSAAAAGGLRLTVHAGEWGGPDQVRAALALDPERVAHGGPAIESPALVAELIARGITLDLCPTSSVQAGLYASVAAHPLRALVRAGVPVTLSTDDRTVSSLTLVEEYRRALRRARLTPLELWRLDRHALDVAFAEEGALRPLRTAFDAWAREEPDLTPPG